MNEHGKSSASTIALVIVIGIGVLIGIAYLNNNSPGAGQNFPEAGIGGGPPQSGEVLIEDISSNPMDYFGKAVTLSGEVDTVRGEKVFVLNDPNGAPDPRLLVVISGLIPQ